MFVIIKSWPELKIGYVGLKTRSLGQFLEKLCVLSRRHSFDPIFMKLCQNDFLTLNKHLSRRAMLSDDSSCFKGNGKLILKAVRHRCPFMIEMICASRPSDGIEQ